MLFTAHSVYLLGSVLTSYGPGVTANVHAVMRKLIKFSNLIYNRCVNALVTCNEDFPQKSIHSGHVDA